MIPNRQSCMKFTKDDWYPSYKLDDGRMLVEVSFLKFSDGSGFRCCVWGGDDDGRDFDNPHREVVWDMYLKVLEQETVDKEWLKDQGFVRA